jgi:hypothetical protein
VRRVLATIGAHGETLALLVEALVRADRCKGSDERSELRKALPVQCTGILDIAMFACGQFRRAQEHTMLVRRDIS